MRAGMIVVMLGLLTSCHADVKRTTAEQGDKAVRIAVNAAGGQDQVSLDLPGVNAKVSLPNVDLARHMDLDGMRLAPETRVAGIDVEGKDEQGRVRLRFTSPQAPPALIAYYRRAANEAGYDRVVPATDALSASKGDKAFTLAVSPEGNGSRGTITMTGAK